MNVRLVIQRGLRYLLARWLLLWGALVPLALLARPPVPPRGPDVGCGRWRIEPAPVLLWFAGVGAIVLAFRGTLIRALDQWALPGVEAPAAALAAMTERMKQARTPLEVAVTLADAIERAMQAPATAYLFIGGAIVPADGGEPALPLESAIPALMEGAREPVRRVALAPPLATTRCCSHTDREWIDRHQIELLVPLLPGRPGSGLLGLVTLSPRRNALGFSDDDIRFVRVAAAAASLACDAIGSEGRRADVAAERAIEEVALQCLRCGRIEDREAGLRRRARAAAPGSRRRCRSACSHASSCSSGWAPVAWAWCIAPRICRSARDVALKTLPQLSHVGRRAPDDRGAHDGEPVVRRRGRRVRSRAVARHAAARRWSTCPAARWPRSCGAAGCRKPRSSALVRQLARSLARVHGRGLYHGDIKPSNIGFAHGGAPKLLDFGLARALSLDRPDEHEPDGRRGRLPLGGTWAYLPPEVRDGAAPGPGLDLWALGVVLCEALARRASVSRARARVTTWPPVSGGAGPSAGGALAGHERVVASMLSLEPEVARPRPRLRTSASCRPRTFAAATFPAQQEVRCEQEGD